jgi:hypothetical protein
MKNCEWCTPGNEVCGTCECYFGPDDSKRCAADPEDPGCFLWKPFGFCPKCGRDLKGGENNEQSNG